MKLSIEKRDVGHLVPYANNSKNHGADDLSAIKASITRFGFNDPIAITPEGVIVEGHGRWMAAQELGIDTVPVLVIEDASEDELDLYRIAHNKIALSSTFDYGVLFATLQDLVGAHGFSYGDMGFSDNIVDNLFSHFGTAEERGDDGVSHLANSATPTYDIVWDSKEDKTRFSVFMQSEVRNGADKAMTGEAVLAAVARVDPELHAQLVALVPGHELSLDALPGATDEVHVHA